MEGPAKELSLEWNADGEGEIRRAKAFKQAKKIRKNGCQGGRKVRGDQADQRKAQEERRRTNPSWKRCTEYVW